MQIRVITRSCKESCFVGTTTRFVSHRAYGNYPKGVTTIAWISGKTEGIDPKLLRFITVCWKASSSVLPTAQTWKASRELCLEALSKLLRVTLTSNLGI